MIKEVKTVMIPELSETPSLDDVKQCIDIANKEDCIVELNWNMKWSGHYSRYIYPNDDPQDVYDNRLPHIYGM